MGLALLPQFSPKESTAVRKGLHAMLALAGGLGMSALTWLVLTRDHDSISWYFLEQSLPVGGGTNVVNVILVDFRGYDTMGEITVLGIAAVGVLALMDGMRARRPLTDPAGMPWSFAEQPLLLRVAASVVLPVALVFSLYIFMRGHNLPGGGFVAGLVFAIAIVMQYMASGLAWTEARQRIDHHALIAAGVLVAAAAGVGSWLFGANFLSSSYTYVHLWPLEEFELATAAIFDLGVFLCVLGAVLLALASLSRLALKTGEPVNLRAYDTEETP